MATDTTQVNTSNSFNGCIGFIGAGVMGTALIKSLLSMGIKANQICISEKVAEKSQELNRTLGISEKSIAEIASQCDLIFLAVKPQDLADLLTQLSKSLPEKTLLLSIAAGKTTAFIESGIGKANPVIRIMPNTPAQVGKGVSAISGGKYAKADDLATATNLLSASGLVVQVAEAQQDAVTALSGSGPAYLFYFVEEMIKSGVALGLSQEIATKLAIGTIAGSAAMLQESGLDAATLRKNVTSPNGTTAAAINEFEKANLAQIINDAMSAAKKRAQELA
jgi:pyrroline-5-carboxylate reductase